MSKTNETGRNNPNDRNDDQQRPSTGAAGPVVPAARTGEAAAVAVDQLRAISRAAEAAMAVLPAAAPSTNFASELNNIPFRVMIGGPLQAAVDAQVASSLATIDFINRVGFTQPDQAGKRELVMVDFTHTRKDVTAEGTETSKNVAIRVPLLAMLPIPSLRIEHVNVDFNVKLNSVETSQVSEKLGVEAEVKAGWGPVSFRVSGSYQRQSTTGVEVKKEYALSVNVKAVQDEMPAGLEKLLGMLAA
ncbi:DUF2589 domain-containing protein [Micromonospora sp. CPCC 206171]|uniref:DUF2589 domain-containing protein n=1 Tax=Micromonospora sp. CPCC 206171 TaxID=3122405 RepID=UPI002FEFAE85